MLKTCRPQLCGPEGNRSSEVLCGPEGTEQKTSDRGCFTNLFPLSKSSYNQDTCCAPKVEAPPAATYSEDPGSFMHHGVLRDPDADVELGHDTIEHLLPPGKTKDTTKGESSSPKSLSHTKVYASSSSPRISWRLINMQAHSITTSSFIQAESKQLPLRSDWEKNSQKKALRLARG
eukprot:gnl/MRDRNA2_/MRDRNA2_221478_c0_seq1.p1 gnl/MRDRNA2_/MRDRNA2_221478_c0~~gnl/MRDRNA2_/MRDRNA2_221478_c0_seq1.p1  ORF type:complete len:176 (+),score=23.28 gnl/MRDRNA2_/MRDRNA2_221478_c0_seq1:168-695(+)